MERLTELAVRCTSAQIASERLAALKDPKVSQALPRLERALDRAVKLATDVLAYGKTQEAAPDPRAVRLAEAVEEAAEEARLSDTGVQRLNVDLALTAKIVGALSMSLTVSDRYESKPLPGKEKNDLVTAASLVYTVL